MIEIHVRYNLEISTFEPLNTKWANQFYSINPSVNCKFQINVNDLG